MKKRSLGTWLILALALTVTPVIVLAQNAPDNSKPAAIHGDRGEIEGVWDVSVTIRQCDTGDPLRAIRAMNLFIHGGTMTETAVDFLRSPSLGTWRHLGGQGYAATFRFFRYKADGSFADKLRVTRDIELSGNSDEFTSTGTVEIFSADNDLISTNCITETATRLE